MPRSSKFGVEHALDVDDEKPWKSRHFSDNAASAATRSAPRQELDPQLASAITSRYARTVASRPAYKASPIKAWPIDTSSTFGTPRRKAPRLAWLRSWPALTPRPAAWARRAAVAKACNAASISP